MADRALAPRRAGAPGPGRIALYLALVLLALVFLLPVYVMLVNSLKPLDEIPGGDLEPGADRRATYGPEALFRQLLPAGPACRAAVDADRRDQRLHPDPVSLAL